ncbi:MAG TPA: LmbE family protein, partial [Opitutae bacterium]|nr:LmbE family protein [Opitutae bacterium]
MRILHSFLVSLMLSPFATAESRPIEPLASGALLLSLQKLNTLGSVLYVAAHPDDENTKLIAYLANGERVDTTYLSLTRGDGGQNLIGGDLGEKLGMIRTQELLAARRIDGGQQRFSRAIDFGYSKTPEETLAIWDQDAALADVVWAIRSLRPDVIITRFSLEAGYTHGHHTASARLAKEAFTA